MTQAESSKSARSGRWQKHGTDDEPYFLFIPILTAQKRVSTRIIAGINALKNGQIRKEILNYFVQTVIGFIHGVKWVMESFNPKYCEIARKRLINTQRMML